jgi:hypothetical protein
MTIHSIALLPATVNVSLLVKVWYLKLPEVTVVPPVALNKNDLMFADALDPRIGILHRRL